MQQAKEEFKDIIDRFIALQFLFDKQWKAVKVSKTHQILDYHGKPCCPSRAVKRAVTVPMRLNTMCPR